MARPESAWLPLGLVKLTRRVEVAPLAMLAGVNALVTAGGVAMGQPVTEILSSSRRLLSLLLPLP